MTATTRPKHVNVEQLVEAELARNPAANPHSVAEQVAAHVGDDQLRQALASALAYVVRTAVGRQRRRAAGVTGDKPDVRSLLDQPVYLGPLGGWRRFGACSVASLTTTITHRRQVAEREGAYTLRLERLAEALEAAEVERVDQLGVATVTAILGPGGGP